MMNRETSAIAAVLLAGPVVAAQPARAQVVEIATGIAGGLVDGVLFGALSAVNPTPPQPTYDEPQTLSPPRWTYAEEQSSCRMQRVRVWNGYGWRLSRTEVCG